MKKHSNSVSKFVFGAMPESTSASGELDNLDLKKTARLLLVTVLGAAATAALDFVAQWLVGADLGPYKLYIIPAITAVLELGRRYVAQHYPPSK